jgi:beta-glucanase (GH16 family)
MRAAWGMLFALCFSVQAHAAWKLVWSDEFNTAGKPDSSKWKFDVGGDGWGNDEAEYYTDRLENARVEDGALVLEARKEDFGNKNYTSARLSSVPEGWVYGSFEIRAKLPRGAGMWPAIWMLARHQSYGQAYWPDNGEVDIMENFSGREPDNSYGCFHTFNLNWMKGTQVCNTMEILDLSTAFHVFRFDWGPDRAALFIDGIQFVELKNAHTDWKDWPYDKPFFLIMNIAVGGGAGGPIDDTIFPQRMYIDYVRVYKDDALASLM